MRTSPGTEILLIEDNPRDAELALRVLENVQPRPSVIWLKDGAEALDWFFGTDLAAAAARSQPAVTLLDLKLPKVDGLEVLRRLKIHERPQLIPVVATGYNQRRVWNSTPDHRHMRHSICILSD